MMESEYVQKLRSNQILAEENCARARELFEKQGKHTRAEAELYCKSGDLYCENMNLSTGADQIYYRGQMERCAQQVKKIYEALKKEKEKIISIDGGGKNPDLRGGDAIISELWFRERPKHTFDDVSGMDELKKKLMGSVSDVEYAKLKKYLKMKNLYGFFFYGPPGCGKTYLIEGFVAELMKKGYQYISLEAKDIISKYAGEAEKTIARMFELAEKNAPCIVFIDEIDGVCKNRSLPNVAQYERSITTAFLTGYNRINSSDKEIIFLGATNYPEHVDNAMLNRVELVRVPLPDRKARIAYFEHALQDAGIHSSMSCEAMADLTDTYDFRDNDRLIGQAKQELYEILTKEKKYDTDRAIEALRSGRVKLDEQMFLRIYDAYKPYPKSGDRERLDSWERKMASDNK